MLTNYFLQQLPRVVYTSMISIPYHHRMCGLLQKLNQRVCNYLQQVMRSLRLDDNFALFFTHFSTFDVFK